ncbi:MAG: phage integrase, partial [Acidobacteriota bacterium]
MKALISNTLLKELKKLDTPQKPYEIRDTQVKGFILRVQPSGVMSYIAEYGRGKRITIGQAGVLKPAEARGKAREKLAQASLGQDPQEEKIEVCNLDDFLEKHYRPYMETHWKTGAKQVQKIRAAFPELLDKKLTEITARMVQERNSERLRKVKAQTVKRDLEALKACFNRAVEWKMIKENPLNKAGLEKPLKAKIDRSARVRYLSADEEQRLLQALDDREERMRKERDSANA